MIQDIVVQRISKSKSIPSSASLKKFAKHALGKKSAEITLRITTPSESAKLNHAYRNKNYPTNILSFPYQTKPIITGDIILCANLIPDNIQKWAHLIIHGVLHLMGYDHETDKEAHHMESLEIKLMHQLGYKNPYQSR